MGELSLSYSVGRRVSGRDITAFYERKREERTGVSPASGEVWRVAVVVMKESQEVSVLQPGGVSTVETVCLFLLMSAVTG